MTNLDSGICRKIRDARREAGISQSVLAVEIGCKQSALSMFEQGDGTKLNKAAVEALCSKFGIDIDAKDKPEAVEPASAPLLAATERGFCPNPSCPSHKKYEVEGKTFLRPSREEQDPVFGKFCAVCGEVLEKRCPSCGRSVHDGAVCSHCGKPYVFAG